MLTEFPLYNGPAIDVFSLGIILFILVMGKKPFKSAEMKDNIYKLFVQNKDRFWNYHGDKLSPELKDLIS